MTAVVTTEIDLGAVSSSGELHRLLALHLHFPPYYGENWDAFWDCVRDPEQSQLRPKLIFRGWSQLAARLPRDSKRLRQCLADLVTERPDCEIVVL
jgi:RNAse (barnase) inhibitor barstar